MSPLVDSKASAAGEVGQKEAVIIIIDVEDACTTMCSASVQEGDACRVGGLTIGGAVTEVCSGGFYCRY